MEPKQRAGKSAVEHVKSGMVVGLGTGSTARFFIAKLAADVKAGKLSSLRCVPTSVNSEKQAAAMGLNVVGFSDIEQIDVTIDGADEIAPDLSLIKGLGGALLREKIVAQNTKELIIIADGSKLVKKLGTHSPLPVEVTQFGHEASKRFLAAQGCIPILRMRAVKSPFVTDNGNYIYDCKFNGIDNPPALAEKLGMRAGIVESGLFLGMARIAIIADGETVRVLTS